MVGRELGVEAVLTGRLVTRDVRVTLALELVDARDNRHLWGGRYVRERSRLAELEQTIPSDLADELRLTLDASSRQQLTRRYTANADAHELYLKGRYAWKKWTVHGSKEAVAYFEEALRRAPNYARRGRAAAMRALSIDPQLAEARTALGSVLVWLDWDFAGAEREAIRAIELNPNYAEAHHLYSHLLLVLGRHAQSLEASRTFLELDPVSESPVGHLGWHYLAARQHDDSIAWSLKDRERYPEAPLRLFDAYYQKARFREATDEFFTEHARLLTSSQAAHLKAELERAGIGGLFRARIEQLKAVAARERDDFDIATLYTRLGEKEHAFRHLEVAYANHAPGLAGLKAEPVFDSLHDDPRFADLLRRIGLPP